MIVDKLKVWDTGATGSYKIKIDKDNKFAFIAADNLGIVIFDIDDMLNL